MTPLSCLSITIAFVGGRSAMITSATGSTALLMTGLVATGESRGPGLGLTYLLVAGIVTGLLQLLWGWLRLAYQMRFVPLGVLSGFVNALALLIFQAQFPQLGINLHFQLELTRAQIPLQRLGKAIDLLVSMLTLCHHATNNRDQSQIRIAALHCEQLTHRVNGIRLLTGLWEMDRLRKHVAAVGEDLEKDQCTLVDNVKPQALAHPFAPQENKKR